MQLALCNKYLLKLCICLYLIVSKPAIMTIYVNQLWEFCYSYLTLLEFVCNNQLELFLTMMFGINTNPQSQKIYCVGAFFAFPECFSDKFKKFAALVYLD